MKFDKEKDLTDTKPLRPDFDNIDTISPDRELQTKVLDLTYTSEYGNLLDLSIDEIISKLEDENLRILLKEDIFEMSKEKKIDFFSRTKNSLQMRLKNILQNGVTNEFDHSKASFQNVVLDILNQQKIRLEQELIDIQNFEGNDQFVQGNNSFAFSLNDFDFTEINNWIDYLKKSDAVGKTQTITIQIDDQTIEISRFVLRTEFDRDFKSDKAFLYNLINEMKFVKRTLGISLPEKVLVHDLFTSPTSTSEDVYSDSNGIKVMTNKKDEDLFSRSLETSGYMNDRLGKTRFTFLNRRITKVNGIFAPDTKHNAKVDVHENAHVFDVYHPTTEVVGQSEAFAVSIEYAFNFEEIKARFHGENYPYTLNILSKTEIISTFETPSARIFENDSNKVYRASGAFYSYIYQNYGPEIYMNFHGLITGGRSIKKDGTIIESEDSKEEDSMTKNNLIASLRAAGVSNPDEFIDEFLQEMNKRPESEVEQIKRLKK